MKRYSLPLIVFMFTAALTAQTPQTAPKPSSTPQDKDEVVRISTNLIQLDVTVTDKNGQPITDLRRDEIEIYENGKKKDITGFTFVPGTRTPSTETKRAQAVKMDPKLPMVPSGPIAADAVRRTVAIVVDDLHLSFANARWVKDALRKFIQENIQDGDLVAIFRTGAGVGSLQQFTSDRRQLLGAVDRLRYNHQAGTSFIVPLRVAGDISPSEYEQSKQNELEQLRRGITAQGTIGSLSMVIRGMRDLPGRRSIVLLTDGLSIYERDSKGRPSFSLSYEPVRRLIDLANRSSVALYPIHAEGLTVVGMKADDDVRNISMPGGVMATDGIIGDRIRQVQDTQDGLRFLAENTGGFAHTNNNDINVGIRRAMDDQSYYLVAYDPDDDTFDPRKLRYNKFDVKVSRPGARVRYRSGFLSVSEEQRKRPEETAADKFVSAITSPFTVSQVDVRMNAIFAADAKGNSSVRSFVNIGTSGLSFQEVSGSFKTSFDIVAFTFGMDGEVIDKRMRNFTITLASQQYKTLQDRGLVVAFDLPVKRDGGYQVRLAVRDVASGRIGSAYHFVDVPFVKNGKLVLSGLLLSSGPVTAADAVDPELVQNQDPLRDTSVRQFRAGSTLNFTYFVYNPKLDRDQKPRLVQSYQLYRDNNLIFTSAARQIPVTQMLAPKVVGVSGGVVLGGELMPGDYILKVDIADQVSGKNRATQFAQFEIIQ